MKCFQVLNDDVLIIDGQKEYHEDKATFLLDGGTLTPIKVIREGVTEVVEPKKVIYDDNQCCCVVNDVFYDYPNDDLDGYIALIDAYIKSKADREYVAPTFEEIVAAKLAELKTTRDTLETEPVEYNGSRYDYDEKARDRINAAIIALDISGQSIEWTTADNTNVAVTAQDLRNIIAAVALRSNDLHVKYRNLKEQVLACSTAEEVAEIVW
ncbi:MAG: DUF4376 domain-containing protein [Phascolarctobacterium sp.]|nr:DUF4376 domain-containing protein [Phascolarctobacterium sp.]